MMGLKILILSEMGIPSLEKIKKNKRTKKEQKNKRRKIKELERTLKNRTGAELFPTSKKL